MIEEIKIAYAYSYMEEMWKSENKLRLGSYNFYY